MSELLKIFPHELILFIVIFVIIPFIISAFLRHALYINLIDSANKVSRLLQNRSSGKQPAIVNKLEDRFRQASTKLEQVNTIALIDSLYAQEKLKFIGISFRYEQWDYVCRMLPNLLLAIGLIGTFLGICSNLINLSQTISNGAADVDSLVAELQTPLQNMGIAFSSSLVAILCSSALVVINSRYNTNFAKSLLISSLEDYLDNIFKIDVQGDTRLDQAVDRMVRQQQEFLERFHIKVGQVLETTIGDAANRMVDANQGFQNNVDSMVSQFNDITQTMATSTDNFSQAAEIFRASDFANKLTTATNELVTIPEQFNQSTAILHQSTNDLNIAIAKISTSSTKTTNLIENVNQLNQKTSELLEQSDRHLQAQITSFNHIQSELENIVETLSRHKSQINSSIIEFSDKIRTSFHEESSKNIIELQKLTSEAKNNIEFLESTKNETNKLIDILQKYQSNLNFINSNLSHLVKTSEQQGKQLNSNLNGLGITSDRLLTSFEQRSQNNIRDIQQLITEFQQTLGTINNIPLAIQELIIKLEKHEQ